MLKHLHLEGFKSWKTLDMEFGRITALFGPNSSGKSSILQFLLLLKQTYESRDPNTTLDFGNSDRGLVDLGDPGNISHARHHDTNLIWSLNWQLPEILRIEDPGNPGSLIDSADEITVSSRVFLASHLFPPFGEVETTELSYEFGSQKFSLSRGKGGYELHSENYEFKIAQETFPSFPELSLPGPIRSYAFPDRVRSTHKNADFLSHLEVKYTEMMDGIYYLGPMRDRPERVYQWSVKKPRDVGARGENTIDAILAAGSSEQQSNQNGEVESSEFQKQIATQLRDMGILHEFSLLRAPFHNITAYVPHIQSPESDILANLPDVGFGVSQVLPVVVLLNYVPEGSTVLLEQPEIHLHPAVQSALGDVIINAMQSRNLQIFVESHSEHLLRRLQRRIAEEKVSHEDMRLYFTKMQEGQSVAEPLELNEYGYIKNWPENFFGDEFGEICKTQDAMARRMKEKNRTAKKP